MTNLISIMGAPGVGKSYLIEKLQKETGFIDDALKDAQEHGYRVSLVYCTAPEDVIKQNLMSRGLPRDLPKYDAWEEFVEKFVDVPGPNYDHLKIDTTNPSSLNLRILTKFLSR
jgi:hypothetical protein